MDDIKPSVQQSSEVTANEPAPMQPPVAEPVSEQPMRPKKKSSVVVWFLVAMVIMLFGLLVSALYVKWTEAEGVRTELNDTKTRLKEVQANLEAAQKKQSSTTAATPTSIAPKTTDQLADQAVTSYAALPTSVSFFVRKEKVAGDFVSLYLKPEATGAEPMYILLKKVQTGQLVEFDRISGAPVVSKNEADSLKTVYGVDVKLLGITVQ